MIAPGTLVPLKAGTILSSASKELQRQIVAVVPEGKRGAMVTIVDKDGIRLGIAASYKGAVTVSLEAHKAWGAPPDASLKVQVVF